MVRAFIIGATCLLAACSPAEEPDSLEQPGERAEAIELPCTAYLQGQNISAGNWIVCGTRPFATYTNFHFTNPAGSDILVRMQSGPDLVYLTVPASGELVWSHQYYGGFVRIEPVNTSVTVGIW
jgi:hypothetical protein